MELLEVIKVKILFVDNKENEFERFLKLPFAMQHSGEIKHLKSPMGLKNIILTNPEVRLIILDLLWEEGPDREPLMLGVDAMRELSEIAPDIPIVIHSVLDDEDTLRSLIPEMMRLGAYDWIGKAEPKNLRSFRFERAYMAGRTVLNRPASRAILPPDQQCRNSVHVAVMFVDMCGFTALTREVGAEAIINILRSFYNLVGDVVMSKQGYIDKYIGDAVMNVFGAATEQNQLYTHVQQSVQAARQICARSTSFRLNEVQPILRKANLVWPANRVNEIGKFRIAIESGPVEIVRFERGNESELTFIGSPVNIASRILGVSGPDEIWVGENVRNTGLMHADMVEEKEDSYKNLPGKYQRYRVSV
jgi:class 3 adenylate cyclase